MTIKTLSALVVPLALAACSGMERSAQEAVRQKLKDPESARFGEFYFNATTQRACMVVSAKNSFGGYGEGEEAFLIHSPDGWTVDDIANVSHDGCVRVFADKAG